MWKDRVSIISNPLFNPLVSSKTKHSEMKTQNNGGRPVKVAGQKKEYRISVKMDFREYHILKAKAYEAGISLSECVRKSLLNCGIRQRLTVESQHLIRKISGMANNLNQIAHKANGQGYQNIQSECLHLDGQIDNLLNDFRNDC